MKILHIEDMDGCRSILKENLESLGCQVVEAETGRDGINIFSKSPKEFSLVVCDFSLTDMRGDDIVKEIRKISDVVIIASSSFKKGNELMLSKGANYCFEKNCDFIGYVVSVMEEIE